MVICFSVSTDLPKISLFILIKWLWKLFILNIKNTVAERYKPVTNKSSNFPGERQVLNSVYKKS